MTVGFRVAYAWQKMCRETIGLIMGCLHKPECASVGTSGPCGSWTWDKSQRCTVKMPLQQTFRDSEALRGLGLSSSSPLSASVTLIRMTNLCQPWLFCLKEYGRYLLRKHMIACFMYLFYVLFHNGLKGRTSTSVSSSFVGPMQILQRQIAIHRFLKRSYHP